MLKKIINSLTTKFLVFNNNQSKNEQGTKVKQIQVGGHNKIDLLNPQSFFTLEDKIFTEFIKRSEIFDDVYRTQPLTR